MTSVKFKINLGEKAIINLFKPDGTKVPFGSIVHTNSPSGNEAITDNEGRVYLSGLTRKGHLIVTWGGKSHGCDYQLINPQPGSILNHSSATCI